MGEKTQKIQQNKLAAVKQVKDMISGCGNLIFTDYRGLNVEQMNNLRRQLREKEAVFKVVKNSYTRIALSELELSFEDSFLIDPTALALIKKEPGLVARVLFDFARYSDLDIKGGVIEGKIMAADRIEALSKLASREQLYAMLMSVMNAPLTRLLYAMNGIVTGLVRTVQAVAEAKEKNEAKK